MGLEGTRNKELLYHLTRLDNMEMIVRHGLLSRKYLIEHHMQFGDVADQQIITKRQELQLDRYTPFHFHPYSAFDVAVKNTYSAKKFVYICIKRSLAESMGFQILIKHPLSQQDCILYSYAEGIKNIDWDTMEKAGETDAYARNVKMAECLTIDPVPAKLFQSVFVPDEETKLYIENLFKENGILDQPPYINVQSMWF